MPETWEDRQARLFEKIEALIRIIALVALVLLATAALWVLLFGAARAQTDLPLERTAAATTSYRAQLATVGEGDEICAVDEAEPAIHLHCMVPDDQGIVTLTVDVPKGQTTRFRAVTKLGTTVSGPSINAKPVEGIPLPPTVLGSP